MRGGVAIGAINGWLVAWANIPAFIVTLGGLLAWRGAIKGISHGNTVAIDLPAFKAIGIQTFGSDSSKPYPNPANATFANGSAPASQYPNGATFTEPISGAQAEARYPTNIYYNVSTEAQEVDEYNHLYLP